MLSDHEQEIVRRGLAASSLLGNEAFREVIQSLTVEAFAVFTETSPAELEKRENQYNLCQGLKAIEAELLTRVQAKDAIEQRENEEDIVDYDPSLDN
ncbi:hypothetical protein UFOVP344_26 [uncultured Caudovirales phage]|uniref:Uncharacterized protein n=1 Tax=uncultured Caudovirales phage TaxID=2100421 RepID=A0A6J5LVV7_9CAUD|nr:hypothetical protein UFOVP344_26 [uncultured Caudovirales phage]